jgi:polyphosphate kinase 2
MSNIIKLEKTIIKEPYENIDDISSDDLELLLSKKGLKHLIKHNEFEIYNLNKVLRQLAYEKRLRELQVELIKMQDYVIENNKKVIIVFEGRDSAGKGGAIRRIMEHMNPRHISEVALPKPSDADRETWYFSRYVDKLPRAGHIVLFNRSWYNRAIVEPVNGFCTEDEYQMFMDDVIHFENMLMRDGYELVKLYFSVSKSQQEKRITALESDALKSWKLSDVDKHAIELWDKYTEYKKLMFENTSSEHNPWVVIRANSKMSARISTIEYILSTINYQG